MELTSSPAGFSASASGLNIQKKTPGERIIALAGNPNVGKSTVFNELTGLNQHTGNWPGKTVMHAQGRFEHEGAHYLVVDLPGTYSLMAHSVEEEVARDFICFGAPDVIAVVCDATCLERNCNLVLQVLEITRDVVVCVNLMDEAKKKHIEIDLKRLSEKLGVPVVGMSARSAQGIEEFKDAVKGMTSAAKQEPYSIRYAQGVEHAIDVLLPAVAPVCAGLPVRWVALRMLEGDEGLMRTLGEQLCISQHAQSEIDEALAQAKSILQEQGLDENALASSVVSSIIRCAEDLCRDVVHFRDADYTKFDRKLDRILTSKHTGIPVMILLLGVVFYITISLSNYPSALLSDGLFWLGDQLGALMSAIHAPIWLSGVLVDGVYRVVAWVVAVMLPPMAIFFPMFTLLEDAGYLPRVAFNLDRYFKRACACGKQALSMCMGFGCNAVGVVGCRIIDSPRERLIAIITNSFVPCNGRFPTLIAIITMFFAGFTLSPAQGVLSTLMLTGVIVFSVVMTLFVSKLLSKTVLRGMPSSFTLELPPYRKPQIGKVLVRSLLDRTLFVLGRAVSVALPAGLIIYVMANIHIDGVSILAHCSGFLDPFARLIGLDGVILMAFILGFPANEIVIPIIIMAYMAGGKLVDYESLASLKTLLVDNGWTWLTAVCTMLFSLMHWPCSTTCLTIKKETQSVKWTLFSILTPTLCGIVICLIVASTARLLGLA
ncbi:MAG: ferrous iron transport protein B [Christensenellales bacterium]|jgi:ferrous iron transport protein B